jgi:hypothetical protein
VTSIVSPAAPRRCSTPSTTVAWFAGACSSARKPGSAARLARAAHRAGGRDHPWRQWLRQGRDPLFPVKLRRWVLIQAIRWHWTIENANSSPHSDLLCCALIMRDDADGSASAVDERVPSASAFWRSMKSLRRVAPRALPRRHPQTVMEWLHLYNTPEALTYQRTGPPFARRSRLASARQSVPAPPQPRL